MIAEQKEIVAATDGHHQDFARNSLISVGVSALLSKDDWAFLESECDALQDTFEKKQIWRTETELRVSVLNDLHFPTPASKYWQAVREQNVFFENLVVLSFEYRRNTIQLNRLHNRLCNVPRDGLDYREIEVDIEEALFRNAKMELEAKDRVREIRLWEQIKKELDDGKFDTRDADTHQLVSYAQSFILQKMAAGNSGNPGERQNLDGKLRTALAHAAKAGVLDTVVAPFAEDVRETIVKAYGGGAV